jgi:hypothetical protein
MSSDCESKLAGDVKAQLDEAIADPKRRYDADRARKCVDAYDAVAASCDGVFSDEARFDDCGRIVDGLTAAGEACSGSAECAAPDGPGAATCGGKSATDLRCFQFEAAKLGDACQPAISRFLGPTVVGQCGFYPSLGLVCKNGKCADGPGAGEPCLENTCQVGARCNAGTCVAVSASEPRALDPPCVGSTCLTTQACTL